MTVPQSFTLFESFSFPGPKMQRVNPATVSTRARLLLLCQVRIRGGPRCLRQKCEMQGLRLQIPAEARRALISSTFRELLRDSTITGGQNFVHGM